MSADSHSYTEGEMAGQEYQPTPEDVAAAQPAAESDLPAWLPEKFAVRSDDGKLDMTASSEKLAASYTELEKSRGAAEEPASPEDPAPPAEPDAPPMSPVQSAQAYYDEHGELDDAQYQQLEAAGISRGLVDSYIEAQQASLDARINSVVSTVGGRDEYQKMEGWARDNMSESEKAAYNAIVNGPDIEAAKIAVQGLAGRYRGAVGHRPNYVDRSESGSAATGGGYASTAEMQRDMANPLYAKDPAYRAKVAQRLAASTF